MFTDLLEANLYKRQDAVKRQYEQALHKSIHKLTTVKNLYTSENLDEDPVHF